jgi:hypothetical protein
MVMAKEPLLGSDEVDEVLGQKARYKYDQMSSLIVDPDEKFEECDSRIGIFLCTRVKGHDGPHVAHGSWGTIAIEYLLDEDKEKLNA